MYYDDMMNFGNNGSWWFMLLFGFLVIVGIVIVIAFISRKNGSESPRTTPLDIASHRYASGEITKEEFDQIKKDLAKT
ncbi:MAG TPA: SHOCT domain-containing protein [Candidatus Microsaccharimonas sp.]|jgi:putative membrane protein